MNDCGATGATGTERAAGVGWAVSVGWAEPKAKPNVEDPVLSLLGFAALSTTYGGLPSQR
jgi:hypothetical protein